MYIKRCMCVGQHITMLLSLLLVFYTKVCLCCNSQDAWYSPFTSVAFDLFLTSITHSDTTKHMQNQLTSMQIFHWDSNASFIVVPEGDPQTIDCSADYLYGTHCYIEVAKATFNLLKKVSYFVLYYSAPMYVIRRCMHTSVEAYFN